MKKNARWLFAAIPSEWKNFLIESLDFEHFALYFRSDNEKGRRISDIEVDVMRVGTFETLFIKAVVLLRILIVQILQQRVTHRDSPK